jgi:hypothetical protein
MSAIPAFPAFLWRHAAALRMLDSWGLAM